MGEKNRDDKQGDVMLLVKKSLSMGTHTYGDGDAEAVKLSIKRKMGKIRDFAVVYVYSTRN